MFAKSDDKPRRQRSLWRRAILGAAGLAAIAIPTMSLAGSGIASAATPDLLYTSTSSGSPSGCSTQAYAFYQQSTDSIWMDVNVQNSNWFSACRMQGELYIDTVFGSFEAATLSAPTACAVFDPTCGHSVGTGWQQPGPTASWRYIDYEWSQIFGPNLSNLITGVHLVIAPR
jgi:hypothetical protein